MAAARKQRRRSTRAAAGSLLCFGGQSTNAQAPGRGRRSAGKTAKGAQAKDTRTKAGQKPDETDVRVRSGDRKRMAGTEKRLRATLLNVDLPSKAGRALRWRRFGRRLGWTAVAFGMLLLAGAIARLWLHHGVFESERFAMEGIVVDSDGWRDADWVRAELGLAETESLLVFDIDEAADRLAADPGVRSVRVERDLSGEGLLHVQLDERRPLAWLEAPALGARPLSAEQGLLLDARGYGWRPWRLLDAWYQLPVVHDAGLSELPRDRRSESAELRGALELVSVLAATEGLRDGLQPAVVRVLHAARHATTPPFRLEVDCVGGQQLLFSLDAQLSGTLAEQCARLRQVDAALAERGARFRRLNLCLRDELPVVLEGESVAAALSDLIRLDPDSLDLAGLVAVEGQVEADADYAPLADSASGLARLPIETVPVEPVPVAVVVVESDQEPETEADKEIDGPLAAADAPSVSLTAASDLVPPPGSGETPTFEEDLASVVQSQSP